MRIICIIIGFAIFWHYATSGSALEIILGCIIPMGLMVWTFIFEVGEKQRKEDRREFAKRRRIEREQEQNNINNGR